MATREQQLHHLNDVDLLLLFHLADSALPVGSFAYSNGLEAMAKFGLLRCERDLVEHLEMVSQQLLRFDLQILASAMRSLEWKDAMRTFHLQTRVLSLRKAAITQGRAWLRLLAASYPQVDGLQIQRSFKQAELPLYFIGAYGLSMKHMNIGIQRAALLYYFCALRDQISAAIRLGLVGPTSGHTMLSQQLKLGLSLPSEDLMNHELATRITASLDAAQLGHAHLYSKQFQN